LFLWVENTADAPVPYSQTRRIFKIQIWRIPEYPHRPSALFHADWTPGGL